jgi:glutamate-1-semialdehyde 2,1-aminomutase
MVARDHTRRKKILHVAGEYHGTHAWCSPTHNGTIDEDRSNIHTFKWNNLDSLKALVRKYEGQVAGIIMTPYHHPAFGDSELPAQGFWQGVRQICNQEGIVLILDDVRAGFRLDMRGSQEYFGFEPDISCYCKAIANGYSISAGVGRDFLRPAASKVFLTGSYWNSAMEMAAAMACIDELQKNDGPAIMAKMGTLLKDGLEKLADQHGFQLTITGPPAIPYVRFTNEIDFYRMQIWATEVTHRGSFFHPHHNWFLSTAHTEKDINETLGHADEAFKVLKKSFDD